MADRRPDGRKPEDSPVDRKPGFATKMIRATEQPCPLTGAAVAPIYASSTFIFDDLAEATGRFAGERDGFVYTRLGNPTQAQFEGALAAAEEAEAAVAFASGMAAIAGALMTVVSAGDHIVGPETVYGSTYGLLRDFLQRFGVDVTLVANDDLDAWQRAIRPNTKVLYTETPANPTMTLTDVAAWAEIGRGAGAVTIVDNTFATPYLQRPIPLGADVVVHSATKYISGHGDVVAGVLAGSAEFCTQVRMGVLKDLGGALSPFDAWLLTRGLKTLSVRMERQQASARRVARFLEEHERVQAVFYPGLEDDEVETEVVQRQMAGPGAMLSFEVTGGLAAAESVLNRVRLARLAVSLGDTGTLIQHPWSMTHSFVPEADRRAMGVTEGLIRLSVGLEDAADVIADLDVALG